MGRAVLLVAAGLLLLAPAASAACLAAVVSPEIDRIVLGPGDTASVRLAIENRNDVPGRALLLVTPPPGWTAEPANPAPLLSPKAGALTTLTVVAPERGTGVASGEIEIRVVVTCEGTGETAPSTAALAVAVTPLAPRLVAWLAALGVLAVGGLAMYRFLGRLAGVHVRCEEPHRDVASAGVASFRVLVENRRTVPEEVTLAIGPVLEGWSATPAAPELSLDAREEKEVWIAVRAPPDARPGDAASVVVHAALKNEPRRASAVALVARVHSG